MNHSRDILFLVLSFFSVLIGTEALSETTPSPAPSLPRETPSVPASGKATPKTTNQEIFIDVTSKVGLKFVHFNGMSGEYYLPEVTGAGGAMFDYDGDGDLDLYLVQGTWLDPQKKLKHETVSESQSSRHRDRLYRNDLISDSGPGRLRFVDVTDESKILSVGYGMGVAAGDYDNDGDVDLYVTNVGSNSLFRNNGDGTFTEVTKAAGVDDSRWSTSAAFFDYDRDGWLDLFVVNYVDFQVSKSPRCYSRSSARDFCGPDAFQPVSDVLFHNLGRDRFENVTSAAGIDRAYGAGLGVVASDFNGDGWLDLYVANDGDSNQLWMNGKNGTFTDEALLSGAAVNRTGTPEASMGVDAGDFDNDGDFDLFLTHLMQETNTLYVNQGLTLFEDRTIEAGLASPSVRYTAFGTGWIDYDNDGWLDLITLNGAVRILQKLALTGDPFPLGQPNQLFRNLGHGGFQEISHRAGSVFQRLETSRGAVFGDIDNDGDTDLLVINANGRIRLLQNQQGNRNHWLRILLSPQSLRRDALGSRVEIRLPGGLKLMRIVRTDGGYCSSNDPRLLFGLGSARQVAEVRVYWLGGVMEVWKNLPIDRAILLQQGGSPAWK